MPPIYAPPARSGILAILEHPACFSSVKELFPSGPTTGVISGHLAAILQPARVAEVATDFFRYRLAGDPDARGLFVGEDCGLCDRAAELDFGSHGLQ